MFKRPGWTDLMINLLVCTEKSRDNMNVAQQTGRISNIGFDK